MDIPMSVFRISLGTSILIAILILLTPLIDKIYNPKWKSWIWFVIMIRLSVPISLNIIKPKISMGIPMVSNIPQSSSSIAANVNTDILSAVTSAATVSIDYLYLVKVLWVVGIAVSLIYQIFIYIGFKRQVLRWSIPTGDKQAIQCFKRVYKSMGLKKDVRLYTCDIVSSPMMIGLFRPTLLLPHENYSNKELNFIFKHELIHHKKHHILFKLLVLVASCIHWFNPMIYLARAEVNRCIELSCDSDVIRNESYDNRVVYGNTIIDSIAMNRDNILLTTYFNQNAKFIKERIKGVLDMKSKKKGIVSFVIVMAVMIVMSEAVAFSEEVVDDQAVPSQTTASEESVSGDIDGICNAILSNDISYIKGVIEKDNTNDIFNAKNSEGVYPLEMTLVMTNCDMAKLLLENGANPMVKLSDGKTIYDKAMESDSKYYKEIFEAYKK